MNARDRPVLIVDDDADIREALTDVLEDRGFRIVSAGNGLEALNLLHDLEVPPSVILLDLMMPIMDGYGFLEELRKDASLPSIPVAVITAGYGIDRSRLDLRTPIVPKPIDVPRLIRTIGGLCAFAEASP